MPPGLGNRKALFPDRRSVFVVVTVRSLVEDHSPGGIEEPPGRPTMVEIGQSLGRGLAAIGVDRRKDLADGLISLGDALRGLERVDLDRIGKLGPIAVEWLPADCLK